MHGLMRPYDCLLCCDQFCTRHELFVHLHNHIGNFYLDRSYGLTATISHFTDVNTGTYTCDLCGIKFSMKTTFEQHKKSHSKDGELSSDTPGITTVVNEPDDTNFRCTVCSKSFQNQYLLTHHNSMEHQTNNSDSHNISYSDLKPSKSNEIICKTVGCSITFKNKKELKKHMIIHKLATYDCAKCKKRYHSKIVYETHIRLCMPDCEDVVLVADEDIDSGPVECSSCSQLFENKKVLKFHQKICIDGGDHDKVEGECNQGIEEIYLKTEVDDDLENLVPEY